MIAIILIQQFARGALFLTSGKCGCGLQVDLSTFWKTMKSVGKAGLDFQRRGPFPAHLLVFERSVLITCFRLQLTHVCVTVPLGGHSRAAGRQPLLGT